MLSPVPSVLASSGRPLAAGFVIALALATSGCISTQSAPTTSGIATPVSGRADGDWRRDAETWGARYRANPKDADSAIRYAQALRGTGQRAQAVAVLEQASIQNPQNRALLGAYGRALADVGNHSQALDVLGRAHSPDDPDWRILSAQGAVLDQIGRHDEAQRYYASALKMMPEQPSILSNLGLSYALSKDLTKAESTLRKATARNAADPRVRQNLALVLGLQGRFSEAEELARGDLSADQASANVAYLRQMMTQENKKLARPIAVTPAASATAARGNKQIASGI
ncbi:MAG TPA: tetratricopeptide repeat protein [Bradyrhizobium sp.]|nr:tetratricopeptide repeat protein [Bradyrhizobium sp.]